MCGILGGNVKGWDYKGAVMKMNHRGPDSHKIKKINGIYLGFARLSIIDLSETAMQPMLTEDEKYAVVFNGEIYDYLKVRKILEKKGYIFRTQSDTEVLLYSFVEWKEDMVKYIDGIFAAAIMDINENKIFLFRDRAGVKPLYYFYDGSKFAFASELKAVVQMCTDIKLQYDETALYDYHTYLYIPDPKTMYRNIFKMRPASCLTFDIEKKKIVSDRRYWKLKVNANEGNLPTNKQLNSKAEELRYHLARVINRQIISDVPVGTFLSGGVDSSIITAITKNYISDLTAYAIGFTERKYDESEYARRAADSLKVNCEIRKFGTEDYKELYDKLPQIYDEPFADTSAYPTYFVCKLAKEKVTVVLTGDGGDELFGGYPRCIYAKDILNKKIINNRKISELYLRNYKKLNWMNLNNKLGRMLKEDLALMAPMYQYGIEIDRSRLREKYHIEKDYDDFWYYRQFYIKELPIYTRLRYLDFMTYLPGDILTKVDRAAMANSLETRVPFLDKEMIEFAFSLSQQECNPNGELKGILKYAYKDIFPDKFFDRRKQGFSMPFRYLKRYCSPQESIIQKLWKL